MFRNTDFLRGSGAGRARSIEALVNCTFVVIPFFIVCKRSGPLAYRFSRMTWMFLQEDPAYIYVACVGVKRQKESRIQIVGRRYIVPGKNSDR